VKARGLVPGDMLCDGDELLVLVEAQTNATSSHGMTYRTYRFFRSSGDVFSTRLSDERATGLSLKRLL
jgi:hypothetical protein